jgi:predicted GTPase
MSLCAQVERLTEAQEEKPIVQTKVKTRNYRYLEPVYKCLSKNRPVTQPMIALKLGVAKSTVSDCLCKLLEEKRAKRHDPIGRHGTWLRT